MSVKKLAVSLAVIATACFGAAQTGHAQQFYTFVSNAGLAANTSQGCSASFPCDTFANALSVTVGGGWINCLDSGDFGPVTINKAVTINCEGASNGGIAVSAANAITINTASIAVNLIGLSINGLNTASGSGIGVVITAPAIVNVRNCKIYGFTDGGGIRFAPTASGGILIVDDVLVSNNNYGIVMASASGVIANMTVRNSDIAYNQNQGIEVENIGTHAGATIEQTTLAFNGFGVVVDRAGAVAVLGGTTIVNNGTGVSVSGGGVLYSFKNNQIGGNGTDGTPLTAYPGGPLN